MYLIFLLVTNVTVSSLSKYLELAATTQAWTYWVFSIDRVLVKFWNIFRVRPSELCALCTTRPIFSLSRGCFNFENSLKDTPQTVLIILVVKKAYLSVGPQENDFLHFLRALSSVCIRALPVPLSFLLLVNVQVTLHHPVHTQTNQTLLQVKLNLDNLLIFSSTIMVIFKAS